VKDGRRRLLAVLLLGTTIASLAAASSAPSQATALRGGTYRVGWEGDRDGLYWEAGFDPTGETSWGASGIYSNLLVRTLVGYNHVAGPAGQKLVPDLAVGVPTPTNGGRTYTFRLKRGIAFGPPVRREITSKDIRYAIERLARPRNGSLYALALADIQGFDAYRAGKAKSISGIRTPSAKTIVFTLTRPAGDFLHRMALPAAGPIPPEVGRCFEGRPGAYGSNLVSSGPYMIEGSNAVRIGACGAIRPARGLSQTQLTLVRNPSYDRKTDSTAARENNPERFVFVSDVQDRVLGHHLTAVLGKVTAGELEDAYQPSFWPLIIRKYAAAAQRRGRLRVNSWGELLSITMNLTQPPFDDVHVRRAMNWIIDRAALRDAYGGPMAGPIAQHVLPDELLDNRLKDFAPFKTPGDHGDLARAKAEMAESKYATKDGVCTAKACKGVRMRWAGPYAPSQRISPIVKANAAKIGVILINRSRPVDRPASNNPLVANAQWVKPWPDPSSFLFPLFTGAGIRPSGNFNWSLVGITPAQAARLGVEGKVRGVPSVDADIARCNVLSGAARTGCYGALDRKLTVGVAPVIPFLWRDSITILGPQVAKWAFDQSTGTTGFAHVAVKR
jgi:peptide/nickel transport system substrate-binding protein